MNRRHVMQGGEQNSGEGASTLPFPFWRVSVAALSSREPGDAEVEPGSLGYAMGDPLPWPAQSPQCNTAAWPVTFSPIKLLTGRLFRTKSSSLGWKRCPLRSGRAQDIRSDDSTTTEWDS